MKNTYSALLCTFLLAGCQSLSGTVDEPSSVNTDESTIDVATPPATPVTPEPEVALPPTDVWERIRSQMAMEIPTNKRIEKQRQWYIDHPQHLQIVSQRAEPFMHLIVEEVERRGLPIELALLPIVESSFDVFAYSAGAAAGIWQFTTPMSKHFGLQHNWWYDGRRDVYASTIAAMDMMEYLHNKMGPDWNYALAAYNTGEGRVFRAIKKNKQNGQPTDYFSLDLPTETERYVPQLLALADVINNAEKYGVALKPIANEPKLKRIDIGSQIDLALAANLADMTVAELHKLNPGYNRWATSPDGPHALLLPIEKAQAFETALAQTDPSERINWVRYTIKSGDSLSVIAQKHHTRTAILQSVNKLSDNTIRVGQTLLIPVAAKDPQDYVFSADQRLARTQSSKRASFKLAHTVVAGDSLWTIARANKVTVKQLASWNGMAPSDPLRQGKQLTIWVNKVSSNQSNNAVMRKVQYTVRSGDSLARIGKKFQVSVTDLLRWNSLSKQNYLQPGQKLKLYVDVTKIDV
ncbi:lytic transglycosylase [Ferrimonas lipolytica]|uniref:LysM peptidoglycan-binding domain-containing protein n=1 Tax=Ferrimonas lipolytica TaxID=2724191 RepID=A0A6H1UCS0_9GAMM|nr:LysM peptidoglycan-binding domain-containing protein [Ferrimonas lipolytica]QIZ76834.1 LysM peptidoglycan-binding domain-containing protein [Ferrimonas lipolytica]